MVAADRDELPIAADLDEKALRTPLGDAASERGQGVVVVELLPRWGERKVADRDIGETRH